MLKLYVRHGMIVDKIREIIYFKQSMWLENIKNFFKKRNRAKNDFGKDFYKLLNNAFFGKTMENVRNLLRLDFFKKYDYTKFRKEHSKLTFNGLHKSY